MKILQLIDTLHPGGAERMAVNISNVLCEAGHLVILCSTRSWGALEKFVDTKVKIEVLNKKSWYDALAFFRLLNILRTNNIQIIHAHSSSVFWAVGAKLFFPKIKVVWHDHYGLGYQLKDSDRKACQWISRLIFAIIAVNENLKNWSLRNMKVNPDKVVFINNFPQLKEIQKKTNKNCTTIVCLANLRPQKDHITLVQAIKLLKDRFPDKATKVLFAGLYSKDDYYRNVVKLINELNLTDVIQITGPVENVAELLATADIGVLSSVSEGLPVSLLEYGMAGLPVVVTDVGECANVVQNGVHGFVVKPGNPAELARCMGELLNNPEQSEQMGAAFKLHIEKNYGHKKFITQYNKLLSCSD